MKKATLRSGRLPSRLNSIGSSAITITRGMNQQQCDGKILMQKICNIIAFNVQYRFCFFQSGPLALDVTKNCKARIKFESVSEPFQKLLIV
jgi:hypothetical protein